MSTPPPDEPVVLVRGLSHVYGGGEIQQKALNNVNLNVGRGELVILTGPSGCGKTTLLTLVGGLRSVQQGSLQVLGQEMRGLGPQGLVQARRSVGFIFQAHNLLDPLTAAQNVGMPLSLKDYTEDSLHEHATSLLRIVREGSADEANAVVGANGDSLAVPRQPRAAALNLVTGLLTRLGLAEHIHKKPNQLSGGQKQRVAVARALINHPRLILADEPTAALDKVSSGIVIDLLKKLTRAGTTVLVVTHDTRIMDAGDRIVAMKEAQIVSDIPVDETVRLCTFLQQVALFAGLSPGKLVEVAQQMERESYPAGTALIRQGDIGDKFYVIRSGKVDIQIADDSGSRVVRTLSSGQFFGELALLEDQPRSATVVSTEPVDVYTLSKEHFLAARASFEGVREELMKVFAQRVR
jgi:putative ABC transport system ATP-binding protein